MWRSPLEAMPKDDAAYSAPQEGGYVMLPGESSGGGAALATRDVTITAPANSTGTVSLGKTFQVQSALATSTGRLRLYRLAAERAADAGRPATVDPDNQTGCLAEGALPAGVAITNPTIPGTSGPDGLVYWAWEGPAATITLCVLTLEA